MKYIDESIDVVVDIPTLIIYISGETNPAIAGFWKDKNGKEHAILEPIYKNNCFGVPVTDGKECLHALKRIEAAFKRSVRRGMSKGGVPCGLMFTYWEMMETAPEDRGVLFMALKASKLLVIPVSAYNRDEINTMTAPEVATAILPEGRREICLTGSGYALLAARNKWNEWETRMEKDIQKEN